MNAIVLIDAGPKGHPHAGKWYAKNPVEPISKTAKLKIDSSVAIESLSLDTLFDAILATKGATKNFVIVCHGSGAGLEAPLVEKSTAGVERELVLALGADKRGEVKVDGKTLVTPMKSDQDVVTLTRLPVAGVQDLRAKMNKVRALKLEHLAFRACNMGINTTTMEAFRDLFGAKSVSAPKQFDAYGTFYPSISANWKKHSDAKREFHMFIEGEVAFGTTRAQNRVFGVAAFAASTKAFESWMNKHITDGSLPTKEVIFHALQLLHPLANGPSVWFTRDEGFAADLVNV